MWGVTYKEMEWLRRKADIAVFGRHLYDREEHAIFTAFVSKMIRNRITDIILFVRKLRSLCEV